MLIPFLFIPASRASNLALSYMVNAPFDTRNCQLHFEEALLSWTTEQEPDQDAGTMVR